MLKVLLKKQMTEVFRSYFYNAKKKQMRSKGNIILMIVLYAFLLIGVLGGMFTGLAVALCGGLHEAGMGWLYFALMSGIAIALGAFGSVFSTYSSLYLPKDNDLLLSMPIPVRLIIISRLLNVYLLGAMYSAVVLLPTLFVYWITAGATVSNVLCGILLFLTATLFVMMLSCLLGWVVAKISVKLKNKSFITVLIALVFIGGYYFLYFKAQELIKDILANAVEYGDNIKGSAYVLYLFGRVGEGDWAAAGIVAAVIAALLALTLFVLSRSFLKIATATGGSKKIRYREKTAKERSAFRALLGKEISRFTSSPNYMLNCGLSVLLIPAGGIALLIKGRELTEILDTVFAGRRGFSGVLICAALMLLAVMNDMAAPSVSLEGKSIWIPQTLPVEAKTVLRAKASMQLILSGLPMLFACVCAAVAVNGSIAERLMICLLPLLFTVFISLFDLVMGLKNPILDWSTDMVPIKQGGAVLAALFGGWGFVILFAAPYFVIGDLVGLTLYSAIWTVIFAAASILLYRWLNTKGAEAFSRL